MLQYSFPMLLVGLAYVINETLDRAMLKQILYQQYLELGTSSSKALEKAQSQNGIYGANYKIAMIVSMFIQAFRYASEPFFFKDGKNKTRTAKSSNRPSNIPIAKIHLDMSGISL